MSSIMYYSQGRKQKSGLSQVPTRLFDRLETEWGCEENDLESRECMRWNSVHGDSSFRILRDQME